MLIGIWKSVEELEETIGLEELMGILNAQQDKDFEDRKFAAALKGIDLDENQKKDADEAIEKARRHAAAVNDGMNENELEFMDIGLGYTQL